MLAGEDVGSEASEWELRERREREEESRMEADELGAAGDAGAGKKLPLLLPTPSFMACTKERQGDGPPLFSLFFSIVISLVRILSSCDSPRRGKGVLSTFRHRADSGREKRIKCTLP